MANGCYYLKPTFVCLVCLFGYSKTTANTPIQADTEKTDETYSPMTLPLTPRHLILGTLNRAEDRRNVLSHTSITHAIPAHLSAIPDTSRRQTKRTLSEDTSRQVHGTNGFDCRRYRHASRGRSDDRRHLNGTSPKSFTETAHETDSVWQLRDVSTLVGSAQSSTLRDAFSRALSRMI